MTAIPVASREQPSRAGMLFVILKLGSKFGTVFVKMFKVLKVGKVGMAAGSMASYAYLATWEFAVMAMAMLFVHESGHVWAMRRCGMRVRGIYFIPFFGGAAVADDDFPTRKAESYIALMGPLWGLALAVAVGLVYVAVRAPVLAAAASWMALVNLLNLLPVNPLDGGRVFKSITMSVSDTLGRSFLLLGLLALLFLTFAANSAVFGALTLIALLEALWETRAKKLASRKHENPMTEEDMLRSFGAYLALAITLFAVMSITAHLPGADVAMEVLRG